MAYSKSFVSRQSYRFFGTNFDGLTTKSNGQVNLTTVRSGEALPKFRDVIKTGYSATTNYTLNHTLNLEKVYPFGYKCITIAKDPPKRTPLSEVTAGTFITTLPVVGSQDVSTTANQALTKLYKRLSEQQTHFHGMQFLGELHETISLFRHPFRSAKDLVDTYLAKARFYSGHFKPRRSAHGKQVANAKAIRDFNKALADAWLETSFGLAPLLADVRDAAKAAMQLAYDDNLKRVRISAHAENPISAVETTGSYATGTFFLNLRVNELNTVEHSVRYLAALDWIRTAATGSLERLLEVTGFRPDLFVPTLYELCPWSFLFDYFSNLGTVIETGCQSQSHVKWCQRTDKVISSVEAQISCFHNDPSFAYTLNGTPGSYKLIRRTMKRTNQGSSLPVVQFQLSLPGKPTQYANMLALWRGKARSVVNFAG